jgi:Ca2+-binding RTX toxin-like protein
MFISSSGARRRWAFAMLAAAAAIAAAVLTTDRGAARGATSALAQLRIEGPKGNLDPGTWYVTETERLKRSRGLGCKRRKGTIEAPGATALGIAETAADASKNLPPIRVRPDDFGLFVCEIGGFVGRPFDDPRGFSGWTYWVDFAGGTQAAELEELADGEQVLWVFADFGKRKLNTGGALELSGVPPSDADGTLTVEVAKHDFGGAGTPVTGAKIKGAESVEDLGEGLYEVTVASGFTTLWAKKGKNIPSNQVDACVRANPANCPEAHGRTIVGGTGADDLSDTAGWDVIRGRGGSDVISLASGGRDEVNCGGGDDVVTGAGDDDQVAASCEEVT